MLHLQAWVKVWPHLSLALSLNTGSPQGCVPSLLLSPSTHMTAPSPTQATPSWSSRTTWQWLGSSQGKMSLHIEVRWKNSLWCCNNKLVHHITKTKEITMDFRRNRSDPQLIYINKECVERISQDSWIMSTTALIMKAQQWLHFLRLMKNNTVANRAGPEYPVVVLVSKY